MSGDEKQVQKHRRCKTCSSSIDSKMAIIHCVACGDSMHLTTKCTGLTQDVIISISGILNNISLICQNCVDLKKKDALLDHISSFRENEEVKELRNDLEETRAEIKVNNLSINAQLQELKSMIEAKTIAAPPPPCEPKPVMHVHHSKKATKEQYDGIRFRGIPELKTSNSRERYEHDLKQVKLITKHLNVTCNVTDLKRLGKFSEGNDRTLIAKIDSDYAK